MQHAARNLSEIMGRTITIEVLVVETVPISQVASYAGSPEAETAGIYLLIDGDLRGQTIMILPVSDALFLVDSLMGVPAGTTRSLGNLERSALAEVGNLIVSGFVNEVATLTGLSLRPTPPAVTVDMLGAIVSVIPTSAAAVSDELLIVETNFVESERIVQAYFWVVPELQY
jgi:chemotaxis protein CheC